jgi:protocatechuate 4,5-dioxygenase beta chain
MARIIGGLAVSHVPAIGRAIADNRQEEAYWTPFFEGLKPMQAWLEEKKPDLAVVLYNDHGLNFFLNAMPTFAVGAAGAYENADEGWGLPVLHPFRGDPAFSWRLIESLMADEFDLVTCQEMKVDHAFCIPLELFWPQGPAPVATVPISFNTVQHPLPSAKRAFKFGQALGRAIEREASDRKVVVIATGGLSHQLEGERAGFINKAFDQLCLEKLVSDPEYLTRYSSTELVALAGSQGTEILMWIAMAAALPAARRLISQNSHIPISNTASAAMLIEPD